MVYLKVANKNVLFNAQTYKVCLSYLSFIKFDCKSIFMCV